MAVRSSLADVLSARSSLPPAPRCGGSSASSLAHEPAGPPVYGCVAIPVIVPVMSHCAGSCHEDPSNCMLTNPDSNSFSPSLIARRCMQ